MVDHRANFVQSNQSWSIWVPYGIYLISAFYNGNANAINSLYFVIVRSNTCDVYNLQLHQDSSLEITIISNRTINIKNKSQYSLYVGSLQLNDPDHWTNL